MMVLVLYPYVYLLARSAFTEQSASLMEAARALGHSRSKSFFAVAMPLARPAIAVGVAMALMETLNDYGTVDYFSVRTLTAGIYDVWLGMGNLGGGAQISCMLLIVVLIILWLERSSRRKQQQFQPSASRFRQIERIPLKGSHNLLAVTICFLPVLLGFIIPATVLCFYAIGNFDFFSLQHAHQTQPLIKMEYKACQYRLRLTGRGTGNRCNDSFYPVR